MRVGFIQFSPELGNVLATIDKIDHHLASAAAADLWVLPELCNSGYNFTSWSQAWESAEEIPHGPFLRYLESLCRQRGIHIASGLNERDGVHLYNSAVLVGPGGYVGRYRKLHLFHHEKDIFQPGNAGLPVFDIGLCRVGMLVCFDWLFPEVWRVLALKGADLICHPSNLVLPGLAQRAVPIHALMNRIYVVTANRTGTEGELTFTGQSTVAGPLGEVLRQASPSEEEAGIVELDISLARDKQITPRNHVLGDRRPDEYSALLKLGGDD